MVCCSRYKIELLIELFLGDSGAIRINDFLQAVMYLICETLVEDISVQLNTGEGTEVIQVKGAHRNEFPVGY